MDVQILDRREFPRDKVCAGWVTPEVMQALNIDLDSYAQGRELQLISGFRTGLIGGPQIRTGYRRTVSYGIRRCEFDNYLLQRAGASVSLGESLECLERTATGWRVNARVETPLVIGAGGHFCPVARFLGARPGSGEATVVAKEVEFKMNADQTRACVVCPHEPELFFCEDLAGYGWCFRKGDYPNIGLGREDPHRLSEKLDQFCHWLMVQGRIPQNIPRRFHGHAYLLYRHAPRKLLDDGVLLVGDAAGLAYPQSGEGIRPAVESGLMAAVAIVRAQGDYRRNRLQAYAESLCARFGKTRSKAPTPERSNPEWPNKLQRYLGKRLLASPWFVRHLVLDRWFLHAHQRVLSTPSPRRVQLLF